MKLDVVCVVGGLLHDVVEDTLTTAETVEEYFGKEVAHVIDGTRGTRRQAVRGRTESRSCRARS